MQYHYEKPKFYSSMYGETYLCNHPIYNRCTLYKINKNGLAVIQQRFDNESKSTYWTEIDPWLIDTLYLNPNFRSFFKDRSSLPKEDLYPTVSVRQIMWGLKMKPLKREKWKTYFDRRLI